ncbi:MAG TPA: trypsin-like peptidase domain-containing protein, partial [Vicinamibacterales bacterium]
MRAIVFAVLLAAAVPLDAAAQLSTLRIQVTLADADGGAVPMRGVVLLLSDNPASAEPKRIVTTSDGSIELNLRPGSYTIESDRPIAFQGKAYEWTQIVEIASGRNATLELTARNADVGAVTANAKPVEGGSIELFTRHQASVVEVWSPSAHATGFLIDSRGLIATNQRAVGDSDSAEVQISPTVKVPARVLIADRTRDVAILWMDPQTASSVTPLPIACDAARPRIDSSQEIFTIATPLFAKKDMTWGTVSDLRVSRGSSGGPVFTRDGTLVGITTDGESDRGARAPARVIPINYACDLIVAADKKMSGATAPSATLLPVEPVAKVSTALKPTGKSSAATAPPTVSSADFEIAVLSPMSARERRGQSSAVFEFGNWTDYVLDAPPLLFIRVMPKLEESLLMTVARGAAATQGMNLPPIKRYKAAFLRMRAYCGDTEVLPV